MKFILSLGLLAVFTIPALAEIESDLLGSWQYDGFYYQDHRYPNPNPELKLTFTFNIDHSSRLYWKRENETGFCERKGTWDVQGSVLKQSVTWLNPANDPSCGKDPDMQMPRATQNRIEIVKDELNLHMELDGKDFIYIVKRMAP